MTNEMIERVAKAVLGVSRANYLNLTDWSEGVAKAAIEAMREPTEEMLRTVDVTDGTIEKYKLMIKAALK